MPLLENDGEERKVQFSVEFDEPAEYYTPAVLPAGTTSEDVGKRLHTEGVAWLESKRKKMERKREESKKEEMKEFTKRPWITKTAEQWAKGRSRGDNFSRFVDDQYKWKDELNRKREKIKSKALQEAHEKEMEDVPEGGWGWHMSQGSAEIIEAKSMRGCYASPHTESGWRRNFVKFLRSHYAMEDKDPPPFEPTINKASRRLVRPDSVGNRLYQEAATRDELLNLLRHAPEGPEAAGLVSPSARRNSTPRNTTPRNTTPRNTTPRITTPRKKAPRARSCPAGLRHSATPTKGKRKTEGETQLTPQPPLAPPSDISSPDPLDDSLQQYLPPSPPTSPRPPSTLSNSTENFVAQLKITQLMDELKAEKERNEGFKLLSKEVEQQTRLLTEALRSERENNTELTYLLAKERERSAMLEQQLKQAKEGRNIGEPPRLGEMEEVADKVERQKKTATASKRGKPPPVAPKPIPSQPAKPSIAELLEELDDLGGVRNRTIAAPCISLEEL